MSDIVKALYVTDDRDLPDDEQRALVIFPGGNGDWYVQVAPKHGCAIEGVRICMSGGAAMHCPGLGPAIAEAYRAMIASQNGERREPVPTREELEREVHAWRTAFPTHQFDGIFDIVETFE